MFGILHCSPLNVEMSHLMNLFDKFSLLLASKFTQPNIDKDDNQEVNRSKPYTNSNSEYLIDG